jgi:hypothetical protein
MTRSCWPRITPGTMMHARCRRKRRIGCARMCIAKFCIACQGEMAKFWRFRVHYESAAGTATEQCSQWRGLPRRPTINASPAGADEGRSSWLSGVASTSHVCVSAEPSTRPLPGKDGPRRGFSGRMENPGSRTGTRGPSGAAPPPSERRDSRGRRRRVSRLDATARHHEREGYDVPACSGDAGELHAVSLSPTWSWPHEYSSSDARGRSPTFVRQLTRATCPRSSPSRSGRLSKLKGRLGVPQAHLRRPGRYCPPTAIIISCASAAPGPRRWQSWTWRC